MHLKIVWKTIKRLTFNLWCDLWLRQQCIFGITQKLFLLWRAAACIWKIIFLCRWHNLLCVFMCLDSEWTNLVSTLEVFSEDSATLMKRWMFGLDFHRFSYNYEDFMTSGSLRRILREVTPSKKTEIPGTGGVSSTWWLLHRRPWQKCSAASGLWSF